MEAVVGDEVGNCGIGVEVADGVAVTDGVGDEAKEKSPPIC